MEGGLAFPAIASVIARTMDAFERDGGSHVSGLADVRRIDGWARAYATRATAGVKSVS